MNLLIYGRWHEGPSKFKATVLVAAFPARAEFGRRRRRIERVTADAVEGRLTAFPLKLSVVAPVIPEPDAAEMALIEFVKADDPGYKKSKGKRNAKGKQAKAAPAADAAASVAETAAAATPGVAS